ncbi:MAG TPA: glycosyltransferase family 39 protein [Polyangia bacterium]
MPVLPPSTRRLPEIERLVWVAALVFTVWALLYRLGTIPDGCFHDEVSIGFNARSIWKTGLDQFGVRFPLYYQGIGDWKGPLPLYAVMLSTALLGNTPIALRVPGLLFAAGMATLLWWSIRALTGNRRLARWLAVWSLLIPVIFFYARSGTAEPACFPFFAMAAIAAVLAFEQRPTKGRGVLAGALLGLGAYAYPAARLFMPLEAFTAVGCLLFHPPTRKVLWPMVAAGVVMALPMAFFIAHNPPALFTRLNGMSIFGTSPSRLAVTRLFLSNYVSHFGLDFLFRTGQKNHGHWHNIGTGFIALWMLVPLIAGLVVLIQERRRPFHRFLLLLLLLAPIPASMTIDDVPHPNRFIHVVPILVLICAVGIASLLRKMNPSPVLMAALIGLGLYENAAMVYQYQTAFPRVFEQDNPGGWDRGMGRALRLAFSRRRSGEAMYLPGAFFDFDGMLIGFWGDLDPASMRRSGPAGSGVRPVDQSGDPAALPAGTLWTTERAEPAPFPADVVGTIERAWATREPLWTVYRKR